MFEIALTLQEMLLINAVLPPPLLLSHYSCRPSVLTLDYPYKKVLPKL